MALVATVEGLIQQTTSACCAVTSYTVLKLTYKNLSAVSVSVHIWCHGVSAFLLASDEMA